MYNPLVSVAVSSSAGSGKTHALTTRLLSMLLGGIRPREILTITFTNAAACEIRRKLLGRLALIEQGDKGEVEIFSRILNIGVSELLDRVVKVRQVLLKEFSLLQISTIHSFFARVIRGFPGDTGVVDVKVVDEWMRSSLIGEAVENFYEVLAEDGHLFEKVYHFIISYRERAVSTSGIIRGVYEEISSKYFVMENLTQTLEGGAGEAERRFLAVREGLLGPEGMKAVGTLIEMLSAYLNRNHNTYISRFNESLLGFLHTRSIKDLLNLSPFLQYGERGMVSYLQKLCDSLPADEAGRFTGAFTEVWSLLSALATAQMRYYLHIWIEVYGLINRSYSMKKRSSGAIDFADIEVVARRFLTRLDDFDLLQYRIDSAVRYLLIDEFQDTSLLQWEALRPIARNAFALGGTVFYVGDVKQSIYRWRGGDPELFYRVRSELGIQEERLPYSYRQNSLLLDTVNGIFTELARTMHPHYRYEEQRLPPGRLDCKRGYVKLEQFVLREELLDAIVGEVKRLEALGVAMKDIAVLCRKNSELEEIEHRLSAQGIFPASAGRKKLLRECCIRDMINVIRFVLDPEEELHTASLLRAPTFRQSYERLEGFRESSGGINHSLLRECDPRLFSTMARLIEASHFNTPSGFLRRVYEQLGVFEAYPQDVEALCEFYEIAFEFEASREQIALQDFLRYLEENEERITLKAGGRQGPSLQTIHGAKGLEFHTVILPFLTQSFSYRLDGNLMFALDEEGGVRRSAIARKAYLHYHERAVELRGMRDETDLRYRIDELNTLYVAMTRACENLILFPLYLKNVRTVGDVLIEAWAASASMEALPPVFERGEVVTSEVVPSIERPQAPKRGVVAASSSRRAQKPSILFAGEDVLSPGGLGEGAEASGWPSDPHGKRVGILKGLLVHGTVEKLKCLQVAEEELDRLLNEALFRLGGSYTRDERRRAFEGARESIRRIACDGRLERFFCGNASSELVVFSRRYPNLLGRIDRLVFGDCIELVDFKTDAVSGTGRLEELVRSYGNQLRSYCEVVKNVYPDKEVRGSLYFTEAEYRMRFVTVFEGR